MLVDETLEIEVRVVGRQEEDARDEKLVIPVVVLGRGGRADQHNRARGNVGRLMSSRAQQGFKTAHLESLSSFRSIIEVDKDLARAGF